MPDRMPRWLVVLVMPEALKMGVSFQVFALMRVASSFGGSVGSASQ
jgi:hypothetical protein